jgi:hypothetical protein
MSLDIIANVQGIANEGATLEISDFLRQSIFDNKPDVVARYGCSLRLISE